MKFWRHAAALECNVQLSRTMPQVPNSEEYFPANRDTDAVLDIRKLAGIDASCFGLPTRTVVLLAKSPDPPLCEGLVPSIYQVFDFREGPSPHVEHPKV